MRVTNVSQKRILLRSLKAVSLILVLAIISLPAWLPPVSVRLLSNQLHAHGWTVHQLSRPSVSWQAIKLDELKISRPSGQSLAVRSLRLNYTPRRLLYRQLDSLRIDQLNYTHAVSAHADKPQQSDSGLGSVLQLKQLTINQAQLSWPQQQLDYTFAEMHSTANYTGGQLSVRVTGQLQSLVPFTLNARLENQRVTGSFEIPVQNVTQPGFNLDTVLGDPFPVQPLIGTMGLTGTFSWDDNSPVSARVILRLDGLGGLIDEVGFSGLNARHHFQVSPNIDSQRFQELKIDDIDVGIPISGFRADIRLKSSNHGVFAPCHYQGSAGIVIGWPD